MLEITGNIFDLNSWSHKPTTSEIALCITTNGVVKTNDQAVMGAGIAKAFMFVYPQLPVVLGQKLVHSGNQVHYLLTDGNVHIMSFPTKHHWRDSSDLSLIENSAQTLAELAVIRPNCTFVLTRPGCGWGVGLGSWLGMQSRLCYPTIVGSLTEISDYKRTRSSLDGLFQALVDDLSPF